MIPAQADRDDMEEGTRVLELFDPANPDGSGREWLQPRGERTGSAEPGAPLAAGVTGGGQAGQTNTASLPGMGRLTFGYSFSKRRQTRLEADALRLKPQCTWVKTSSKSRRMERTVGGPA